MAIRAHHNYTGRGDSNYNYYGIPTKPRDGVFTNDIRFLENWVFIGKTKSIASFLKKNDNPYERCYFRPVNLNPGGEQLPLVIDIFPLAKSAHQQYADAVRKAPLELFDGAVEIALNLIEFTDMSLEYKNPLAPERFVRLTAGIPNGGTHRRRTIITAEDLGNNAPPHIGPALSFEAFRRILKGNDPWEPF